MNLFIKTLTGAFAALVFQASPLFAAETEPLRLAMLNEGCRPGFISITLDNGSSICSEEIDVSGSGGGNPALNLPDPRGGGNSSGGEPEPYDHVRGGGAGGNPAPEKPKRTLSDAHEECETQFHGKWVQVVFPKNGKNITQFRCEWSAGGDAKFFSAYDKKGELYRNCFYKPYPILEGCSFPQGSKCDVPRKKRPAICDEPDHRDPET